MGRKPNAAKALAWSIEAGFDIVGVVTDSHLPVSATRDVAERFGLSVHSQEEIAAGIMNNKIAFDVAVSFVYWRKIKEPIFSHPEQGVINFHPAPLPDYKGTGGYNVAILESLESWAATAHYIDADFDTGPIIDIFSFSIDAQAETARSLEEKTQSFMLALYQKTMRRILRGEAIATQPNVGGRYISREEMNSLKAIQPNDDIDRKIRAFWFPPYDGATLEVDGKSYTLVNREILQQLADPSASNVFMRKVR